MLCPGSALLLDETLKRNKPLQVHRVYKPREFLSVPFIVQMFESLTSQHKYSSCLFSMFFMEKLIYILT